jgi:BirA family biotin operon repressor/biotin-[acetyl-CoA-carboxylase] ligase
VCPLAVQWTIDTRDKVTSTQDIIRDMARQGKPEGTVVQALQQTAGRGRHGRQWVSDKGNFYISLLLKPAGEARHVGQMGLMTGVAVAETIRKYLREPDSMTLKWPNDVLIEGQKCAGMLVETELTPKNSLSWVGIGVGINIVSAPKGIGVAMEQFETKPFGLPMLRTTFLTAMDKYYMLWQKEGFEAIRDAWLSYAHKKGSKLRVRVAEELIEGSFQGIDESGSLLMTDQNMDVRKITAGEVYV